MKTRKLLSGIITLAMVLSLLPMTVSVSAEADNKYVERAWDGTNQKVTEQLCDIPTATTITSTTTEWQSGWYVAEGEVEISSAKVQVTGGVNLVLKDGCKLTVSKGITVSEDSVLTVYAQKGGTGELTATGKYYDAGIGTNYAEDKNKTGTVNIHGGKIKATGGSFGGAGIGNGSYGVSGCKCDVVIYGGKIEAVGGDEGGAGIGGGKSNINWNETDGLTAYGHIGNITIYNGKITASGGYNSAGIGGGCGCDGGSIAILGGNITATGGETSDLASDDARAIGGGWFDGMKTQGMSNIVVYSAPVGVGTITIGEEVKVKDKDGNLVTLPDGKTWAETLTGTFYTFLDAAQSVGDSIVLNITGRTFTAAASGPDAGTGIVTVALYDSEDMNILLDVKVFELAKGQSPTGKFTKSGYIRAYWWTDFDTMIPLCNPDDGRYEVKLEKGVFSAISGYSDNSGTLKSGKFNGVSVFGK